MLQGEVCQLFEHKLIDNYSFNNVPLDMDCYLMDEKYIKEFEKFLFDLIENKNPEHVGYVGYASIRKIHEKSLDLSWFPNIHTRFHEVATSLPINQFIACVGCWQYDIKPIIFVKNSWFENLYLRQYSVFGMVDAAGVKEALRNDTLTRKDLLNLRGAIDQLAEQYPEVSFISFADSVLLKSNWTVGHFESEVNYTYKPEIFLYIAKELQSIYEENLGLDTYAIFTQGSNEFYEDSLLHISDSKNHICLNSLGIPFAQLISIDNTAREAIRSKIHKHEEIYMDKQFFHSLRFKIEFVDEKHSLPRNNYRAKMMSTESVYFYSSIQYLLDNLRQESHSED